jgi:hypothetical protein
VAAHSCRNSASGDGDGDGEEVVHFTCSTTMSNVVRSLARREGSRRSVGLPPASGRWRGRRLYGAAVTCSVAGS